MENALASAPVAATVRAPTVSNHPEDPSQAVTRSFAEELRALLRLAGPIVLVQFGTTALNFVDVAMLGRHEPGSLPAMALGNTLAWAAMVFGFGAIAALDPLLSQALGAKDHDAVPRLLGRGLLLGVLLTVPIAALLWPAATWLTLMGQPTDLIPVGAEYARLQAFGVLPFLWFAALRSLLSAKARIAPQVATILAGNVLNGVLDYWLVFGGLGVPAMGARGAALATVAVRWAMVASLLWFGRAELGPPLRRLADPAVRAAAFARQGLLRLLRHGAPIGMQFLLEMGVFAATGFLIGHFDEANGAGAAEGPSLSGHQIALQLASLSFMVPLGIGLAASVRVGWATGRGDLVAVRRSVRTALVLGGGAMALFMLGYLCWPEPLARLLSRHEPAIAMAALLIPIAGVFQIGDGVQVVAIGCLRGLGDLRSPVVANIVGFWVLGLPLGCWLAFGRSDGPAGLWWGLVAGLFVVAFALLLVLRLRVQTQRERLRSD